MGEDRQRGTTRRAPMEVLEGLACSPGLAIGPAVCIRAQTLEILRIPIPASEVEQELLRFRRAIELTAREIGKTRSKVAEVLGSDLAGIFEAHRLILQDPAFADTVAQRIEQERVNAEWVIQLVADELEEQFAKIETQHLRERGQDLRDVTRYLLRTLQGQQQHQLDEIPDDVVIVARELTPSDALRLGREQVAGFALELGGPTSHSAIVARALDLPLVTGLTGLTHRVRDDDPVIVDGDRGTVTLHASSRVLAAERSRSRLRDDADESLAAQRDLPSVTVDGTEITLRANIELPEELSLLERYGASGIGLYRSEFLFMERSPELPSEDEQYELLGAMVDAASGDDVVVRTFDLGGRKVAEQLAVAREENPALGLRGLRLTMAHPEVFHSQLRAILRAGASGGLSILLPMVSNVEEVRRFRRRCLKAQEELAREGTSFAAEPRIGAMIEVPSAALIVERLAEEVDFLSIGTNDLIQYTLATDRSNEEVADYYQPLHPAVLTLIRRVTDAADAAGIEATLCGEMAGDPELASLLIGLGLRSLSMSPRSIPSVKAAIRQVSKPTAEQLADRCLLAPTARDVDRMLHM